MTTSRPILRAGFQVPFDKLEPEPFADFVHGVLHFIANERDWIDLQQPDIGADGGFDSWATHAPTGQRVCIQCKRHQEPISIPQVARELARVALEAAIEGTVVSDHLIITSGKVRQKLRSALRAAERTELRKRVLEEISGSALQTLCTRAENAGINVHAVATAYIDNIRLVVWSGHELDGQLGLVWKHIQPLLERTFAVQTLVAEYPRPDFKEKPYQDRCQLDTIVPWIEPQCRPGLPPPNILEKSATDLRPRAEKGTSLIDDLQGKDRPVLELLKQTPSGTVQLLVGIGGAGKSTILEQLRATLLTERHNGIDRPLPIIIALDAVGESLDQAIHAALDLHWGHWSSIPGPILLLLDGLDEVPIASLGKISKALLNVLAKDCVAAVVTTRDSGPMAPIVLSPANTFHILPFGPGQVVELASRTTDSSHLATFVDAWLNTVANDTYLAYPQAVVAALHGWWQDGLLPNTQRKLLERVLEVASIRKSERGAALPDNLVTVPWETIIDLAKRLVETVWLQSGARSITVGEYHSTLSTILQNARLSGLFGADALNTLDVDRLLKHNGFAVILPYNHIQLPHQTICAYLASNHLARTWRTELDSRTGTEYDRAWLAAVLLIAEEERTEFLSAMAERDLELATRLARESEALSTFESYLLREAASATRDYRQSEVAMALALAGTSACVDKLREWEQAEGHLGNTARIALAHYGDAETVSAALMEVDKWVGSGIEVQDEATVLWSSSPFSARLSAAKRALAQANRENLAESFRTVRTWGTRQDADLIFEVLEHNELTLRSLQNGILALYSHDQTRGREILSKKIREAPIDDRLYLLEIAISLGEPLDKSLLVDEILAPPDPPPDPHPSIIHIGDAKENRRLRAFELLESSSLPDGEKDRVLAALEDVNPHVRYWAWRIAQRQRFHEAEISARAILADPCATDESLYNAALFLAEEPEPGQASNARRHFQERYPDHLSLTTAYHFAALCEAEGDMEGHYGIVTAVIKDLAERLDTKDGCLEAGLALSSWGDYFRAIPDLMHDIGLRRILSWNLLHVGGAAPRLIESTVRLVTEEQLVQWLPTLQPLQWRCRIVRVACEKRSDLRSQLVESIAELLPGFVDWLPPQDLLCAAQLCWCDRLAQAVVDTCMAIDRRPSRIAVKSRARGYLQELGPMFTREQVERLVAPVLGQIDSPMLRDQLEFYFDLAHRRQ